MNMNKEYRAELRILKRSRKNVRKDWARCLKTNAAQMRKFEREAAAATKRANRATEHLDKRIAILEGRLS